MAANKNFVIAYDHPKALVLAALGVGVVLGAGSAFAVYRLQDRSRITQEMALLHSTILEVKHKIAQMEKNLNKSEDVDGDESSISNCSRVTRKQVRFSYSSNSYKSAQEDVSCDSKASNDTEYFSPDENDDEFFDLSTSEDEREEFAMECLATDEVKQLRALLAKVDLLLDGTSDQQKQGYNLLKDNEKVYENNSEVLWRLAKAMQNMAVIEKKLDNKEERKRLIYAAFDIAEKALAINDKSSDAHKFYAIIAGEKGEFLSLTERLASGLVFKTHIEIALELNPNDPTIHHLYGRFCFELSSISWIEMKAAKTFFNDVPESSFEEALQCFIASDQLARSKENCLFIAKCYEKTKRTEEVLPWLQFAANAPTITPNDEMVQNQVAEMLAKYS